MHVLAGTFCCCMPCHLKSSKLGWLSGRELLPSPWGKRDLRHGCIQCPCPEVTEACPSGCIQPRRITLSLGHTRLGQSSGVLRSSLPVSRKQSLSRRPSGLSCSGLLVGWGNQASTGQPGLRAAAGPPCAHPLPPHHQGGKETRCASAMPSPRIGARPAGIHHGLTALSKTAALLGPSSPSTLLWARRFRSHNAVWVSWLRSWAWGFRA